MVQAARIAKYPILALGTAAGEAALAEASVRAREAVISLLYGIEENHDVPLAPVIYTVSEYEENSRLGSSFVANVEREGRVLYDAEQG